MDVSRRNLLFGRRPTAPTAPRPPWASTDFAQRCTRCNDCVSACPTQIIKIGDAGFPSINFSAGECTFCGDCVTACSNQALVKTTAAPWQINAKIADSCLAERGVECRICGEVCDEHAIRFEFAIGKVARPLVNSDHCTGCGACVAPCPSQSLSLLEIMT